MIDIDEKMKKTKVWKNVKEIKILDNRKAHLEEKSKYVLEKYKALTGEDITMEELMVDETSLELSSKSESMRKRSEDYSAQSSVSARHRSEDYSSRSNGSVRNRSEDMLSRSISMESSSSSRKLVTAEELKEKMVAIQNEMVYLLFILFC